MPPDPVRPAESVGFDFGPGEVLGAAISLIRPTPDVNLFLIDATQHLK
jgi:hypothetical protein